MEGTDQRLNAALKGLMMESSSGLAVLEPTDAALDYNSIQGKSSISVSCTDVAFRVPLNMFRLMQRLSTDLSAAMKFTGGPLAVQCRQFQRIWETPPGEFIEIGTTVSIGSLLHVHIFKGWKNHK